jgi:formate dehydrogenase major subunit
VVLPVGTWAEQAGHFVNLEGRVQKAARLLTAPEGVRDNQAVLDSLANRLAIDAAVDWKARLFGRPAPVALNLNGN